MEKKLFGRLTTLLFSGVLLVGCGKRTAEKPAETDGTETENVETVTEEKVVTVAIYVDGESVDDLEKEIAIEEEESVLDIMDEYYDIDGAEEGFITAIEGYEQDDAEGLYWMYYVNEEMAPVGAADYIPEEADVIEWKLEKFEE